MEDIDQNRFPLMAALTRANEAQPDDYPDRATLLAMNDTELRSYAVGLLHSLEAEPQNDELTSWLKDELGRILQHAA